MKRRLVTTDDLNQTSIPYSESTKQYREAMRLLFRLLLAIMSFLLVLALLWLSLPHLLESVMRSQLTQQGFSVINIEIGKVGLQSTAVERLQISNEQLDINLQGLQAEYQLSDLISGSVISILADQVRVNRKPGDENESTLPDPMLLLSLLKTNWDEYLPARSVVIDELSIYDENGALSLKSSVNILKQGKNVNGEIMLVDRNSVEYLLNMDISSETGAELQLHRLAEGEKHPLSIKVLPAEEANGLNGKINIDLLGIAGLFSEVDGLSGQLQSEFSYLSQPGSGEKSFAVQASVIEGGIADWQVKKATAVLQGNLYQTDSGFRLEFAEPSSMVAHALSQQTGNIKALTVKLPKMIKIVEQGVQIAGESGASVILDNVRFDNLTVPKMQINNIALASSPQSDEQAACRFSMQLKAPAAEISTMQISAEPVEIEGVCPDIDKSQWAVSANVANLTVEDSDFLLPLNHCRADIKNLIEHSLPEFEGKLFCQSSKQSAAVHSKFRFNAEFDTGSASYSFSGINPNSDTPLFKSLLKGWKEPYDIVSGSLSFNGEYRWWKNSKGQDREKLNMNLNVRDAGGYYDGILFSGLNYKDSVEILPTIKSAGFAELTVSDIDIGIPIEQTSAGLQYSNTKNGDLPIVTMNNLSMSLLGGKVLGNDVDIDLNGDSHNMVLVVVGLDLSQIVALQQVDGLTATGRIDGYVPIHLSPEGMKITDGKIVSQPQGGQIKYAPTGGTAEIEKSAVGSEFVFRIIEDLKYDSLDIDVNYDVSGEMEMILALKGMSPKVDKKRPVHFNLKLQQNVLKLLRGLRYAEGLSEDIDRNVQKYFRKQENPVN